MDLPAQVETAVLKHGLCRRHERLVVAVSGGVDSMVLLHCLHELTERHRWKLVVAHFNHQLRGRSSAADERLVSLTARRLGLPMASDRANVRQFARKEKLSVEMAARQLRHAFLARVAKETRSGVVALAHHADDQVELFFVRLLRGASPQGLSGMAWRSPSPANPGVYLIRPLLGSTKAALEQFASRHRVPFRTDASNVHAGFLRNRIRHHLLPLLRKSYQPALDPVVLRTMDLLRAESEFLTEAGAREKLPTFAKLPLALQRRSLQVQLITAGVSPEFDLVEHLRLHPGIPITVAGPAAIDGPDIGEPEQAGGKAPAPGKILGRSPAPVVRVLRDETGRVTCGRGSEASAEWFLPATVSLRLRGRTQAVEFGGLELTLSRIPAKSGTGIAVKSAKTSLKAGPKLLASREMFDAARVGEIVILRHWQPGDRYQPIGLGHTVKLQDCFTNLKVAAQDRRRRVVATTAEGEIFWVEGLRISERFKLTPGINRVLLWKWRRA